MQPQRQTHPAVFSRAASREVDRLAVAEFGIPTIVLMENAARGSTDIASAMLGGRPDPVLIVAGNGNNGGDGLAMARHLHNSGHPVAIMLLGEPPPGDAATNLAIVRRMRMPVHDGFDAALAALPGPPALVADAIFGTGLSRPPEAAAAAAIARIATVRTAGARVLAIDIPSGLDCDSGNPLGHAVVADATATFVGIKPGFLNPHAAAYTGPVTIVNIGVPRELVDRLGRKP